MGVDGLPILPDELADPDMTLDVEIESVGKLGNRVAIADGPQRPIVAPDSHPSHAVLKLATSGSAAIESADSWTVRTARHVYTAFGNDESAESSSGLARLDVPRFLNGPASALVASGSVVRIPPRATDIVVGIELAVVVRELAADVDDGGSVILGYTPVVSLCDLSFRDEVTEPARAGERGIPAVYGRWADGFLVVNASPTPVAHDDWEGREMILDIGEQRVAGSTSQYIAGPGPLIATISSMITLFPGDVVALGSTAAQLRITREQYAAGLVVRGSIAGLGEVHASLSADVDV